MRNDPTFWILARASGLTAYLLLTASVIAGLVLKARPFGRTVRVASVTDAHRFLALVGLGMVALHGIALAFDRTVKMPASALFVPGQSTYRPAQVAAGVVAAELAALIAFSFSVRRRIGVRNWRRLHWSTYVVFALTTVHGLTAGTDSSHHWVQRGYLASVGSVAFATAWRAFVRPVRASAERST